VTRGQNRVVPDSELRLALQDAIARLGRPVSVSELRSALPKPFRRSLEALSASLAALVRDRALIGFRDGKTVRFAQPLTPQELAELERDNVREHARTPSAGSTIAEDDETVLVALRKMASREPPGSLLSLRELRRSAPTLSKARFDAAVLRLSRASDAVLHHHDFPASLGAAERKELVQDEHGVHYIGIAPGKGLVGR
jgi:hypothetical protein